MELTIDEQIKELERQSSKLKYDKSVEKWNKWSGETEEFIKNKLIGKTLMRKSSIGYCIFKVNSYKKQNWFNSQNHKSWFEIETDGYFNLYGPLYDWKDTKKLINGPIVNGKDFRTYTLLKEKKDKIIYSNIDYTPESLNEGCRFEDKEVTIIGKYQNPKDFHSEPASYNDDPPTGALHIFQMFVYEIPEEMYKELKVLAMDHIQKIINFDEKWNYKMSNLQQIWK